MESADTRDATFNGELDELPLPGADVDGVAANSDAGPALRGCVPALGAAAQKDGKADDDKQHKLREPHSVEAQTNPIHRYILTWLRPGSRRPLVVKGYLLVKRYRRVAARPTLIRHASRHGVRAEARGRGRIRCSPRARSGRDAGAPANRPSPRRAFRLLPVRSASRWGCSGTRMANRATARADRPRLPLSPSYAFSFLSYLTGSSVDHCGAPLRCQKAQPARQRLNCSLQTGEWCIHAALPGNQQNVPTFEERQSADDLPEPAPSSVPCDRQRSGTLADDEPEADVRERVGRSPQHDQRMSAGEALLPQCLGNRSGGGAVARAEYPASPFRSARS